MESEALSGQGSHDWRKSMPYNPSEMMRLSQSIQMLFKISAALERRFPGRKFTLDGHLVGSIGEVIAAYHYNLELLVSSTAIHDAVSSDRRLVQIKATQGKRSISLRSEPDYLIVLCINSESGEAREVYNGPGAPVWEACGKLASTGMRPITLSKLRQIGVSIPITQKIQLIRPFFVAENDLD